MILLRSSQPQSERQRDPDGSEQPSRRRQQRRPVLASATDKLRIVKEADRCLASGKRQLLSAVWQRLSLHSLALLSSRAQLAPTERLEEFAQLEQFASHQYSQAAPFSAAVQLEGDHVVRLEVLHAQRAMAGLTLWLSLKASEIRFRSFGRLLDRRRIDDDLAKVFQCTLRSSQRIT